MDIGSLESMPLSAVSYLVKSLLQQREGAEPNKSPEPSAYVGSLHNGLCKPGEPGESASFANASAKHLWTRESVPAISDSVGNQPCIRSPSARCAIDGRLRGCVHTRLYHRTSVCLREIHCMPCR